MVERRTGRHAFQSGESEELPVTWDGSSYNATKIGGQFINGTFDAPLPLYLENPDNRQPKAYITIVNAAAAVLSMEQVFDAPRAASLGLRNGNIPGYAEYTYKVTLQYEDGTVTEETVSYYTEEK